VNRSEPLDNIHMSPVSPPDLRMYMRDETPIVYVDTNRNVRLVRAFIFHRLPELSWTPGDGGDVVTPPRPATLLGYPGRHTPRSNVDSGQLSDGQPPAVKPATIHTLRDSRMAKQGHSRARDGARLLPRTWHGALPLGRSLASEAIGLRTRLEPSGYGHLVAVSVGILSETARGDARQALEKTAQTSVRTPLASPRPTWGQRWAPLAASARRDPSQRNDAGKCAIECATALAGKRVCDESETEVRP
jgi:hypothetical protein